jgi:hypothetical protein
LIALAGWMMMASLVLVAGLVTAVFALQLLELTTYPAKVKGVHTSFPVFVRLAYIGLWLRAHSGYGPPQFRTRTVYGAHRGTL